MGNCSRISILVLAMAVLVLPWTSHAAIVTVNKGGGAGVHTTLSAGIAAANPNDVIQVTDAGDVTYTENNTISKILTITYTGGGTCNLTNSTSAPTLRVVTTGNLTLAGFNLYDSSGLALDVDGGVALVLECNIAGNDGDGPALGGDENGDINVYNGGSLTLNQCVLDQTSRPDAGSTTGLDEGVIAACNGAASILTLNDCEVRGQGSPTSGGPFGSLDCQLNNVSGTVTVNNCELWVGGNYGLIAFGFDSPSCLTRIFRSVFQQNPLSEEPCEHIISGSPLGLDGGFSTQFQLTNVVVDGGLADDLENSDGTCIFAQNGTTLSANFCTIVNAGRYGIYMIGNGPSVTLANSLNGEHGREGTHWDSNVGHTATLTQDACHYYGSPNGHFSPSGNGLTVTSSNVTFDTPPLLNDLYEITAPSGEFTDSALSSLIDLNIANDLDEMAVRPRGPARDKGAQEGTQGVPTPTSTPNVPTATPSPTPLTCQDTDGDLICNSAEGGKAPALGQSNLYLPDSDGDGLSDGTEDVNKNGAFNAGSETNTRDRDTDDDGYTDGVEQKLLGSDPKAAGSPGTPIVDADADQLPDALDPNSATNDADADRHTDEYEAVQIGVAAASNNSVRPPLGDVNEDGSKDNADSQLTLNFFGNQPVPVGFDASHSDVNRDAFIDNGDSQQQLNFFGNQIPVYPVPSTP